MEGKTNGLQIAGFVVSLVSCFIFGFYGLAGITGLVLSAVGRSQAKQNGGKTLVLELLALYQAFISAIGGFISATYTASLF